MITLARTLISSPCHRLQRASHMHRGGLQECWIQNALYSDRNQ
jgi:hypothetical protein